MNTAFVPNFAARPLILACFFTCVAGLLAAQAQATSTLNPSDRIAIRATVQAQLKAIHANDADGAFAYATVELQRKVGSPYAFMQMIRESYEPVYQPRAVFFQDARLMEGVATQHVLFMDQNGAPVKALYSMQRQSDGTWRINGCMLYRGDARVL